MFLYNFSQIQKHSTLFVVYSAVLPCHALINQLAFAFAFPLLAFLSGCGPHAPALPCYGYICRRNNAVGFIFRPGRAVSWLRRRMMWCRSAWRVEPARRSYKQCVIHAERVIDTTPCRLARHVVTA